MAGVPQPTLRTHLSRPPYVDPTTNIMYDTDNSEYEGWLTKQSVWLKDWRRRYFVLKGSKLFFCKHEYGTPHGMIDLAQCTTVKSADLKSKKRHSFEISTPEFTFLLYADTEQEKDDWIGRVGKAIVRCSSTYYSKKSPAADAQPAGITPMPPGLTPQQQQQFFQQQQLMMMQQQQQQQAVDEDDDDDFLYYNDPNNPNPYFND
mmetsp:Transcript_16257/g.45068  ORF Transcript_16257/g.45068 Transcript_16257/m.45068 type:complete len:204 (-) Transcript_16257:293-904(-)|eukprot:CAMPEP_0198134544 /NCGR_PEP_ID=MMETSP1442-20131203/60131_1 /TAXON_ID= /ORGANISM="Craspedostauros australis, Strain CCMP3328" /LENGTH=203 /DNA_ID=CAMNT_0043795689 /DNA_START=451 /DNA_END=1062 /DNA_ORIENTATION=-